MFHLLLGKLHMGHWLDVVVAGDSQQSIISNSSVVDPDMRELGDGGCLEQTGIIQPSVVKGQQVQLTALQGGQAAAVDPGVPGQQQDAQWAWRKKRGKQASVRVPFSTPKLTMLLCPAKGASSSSVTGYPFTWKPTRRNRPADP